MVHFKEKLLSDWRVSNFSLQFFLLNKSNRNDLQKKLLITKEINNLYDPSSSQYC